MVALTVGVGGCLSSIHSLPQQQHETIRVVTTPLEDAAGGARLVRRELWHENVGASAALPCPNATAAALTTAVATASGEMRRPGATVPFAVLGVATSPKNTGHRSWIRATWMSLPNVQTGHQQRQTGTIYACFLIGVLKNTATAHAPEVRRQLRSEQREHADLLLLNARETKPPGEKMIGFFRWCVTAFGTVASDGEGPDDGAARTRYCVKTDDDAYIQTVRLELNLRALWSGVSPQTAATSDKAGLQGKGPMQYAGATLWASYLSQSFEVCGHGMGPNMATGAAKTERCAERGGIGPFPYVAGTLEVLSMPLAEYIAEQDYVGTFVQRAHARTPVAWSLGEDTVLGMWVHQTPFAITALHWGWDKIHDLCFTCKDKTQLWKPITTSTVVVHIKGHQASWYNFDNVHRNMSARCDSACMQTILPFDVPNLANLCGRNENIRRGYSKCSLA